MGTKAKSNSVITARAEVPEGRIVFTVLGVGDITFDVTKASGEVTRRALYHGLTQRVSDAAAIPFNKAENRYATPQEKYEAMRELVEHYHTGTSEWSRKRSAGGARVDVETALILRALAEHRGASLEDMRERVKALSDRRETTPRAYLAGVLVVAQKGPGPLAPIAEIYTRMRAEQPAPEFALDQDDLLAELGGGAQ